MYQKTTFFIVFLLLFVSNDSQSMSLFFGEKSGLVQQVVYAISICYLFVKLQDNNKKATLSGFFLLSFTLLLLSTAIFNNDFTLGYVVQFLVLFLGYLVAKKIPLSLFVDSFLKLIWLLTIVTTSLFFLFILFPSFEGLFPLQYNSVDNGYINLFFYIHHINMFRNTGVFREPGVFMIFLNIALLFEVFYRDKTRKKYVVVFIVGLLTTLSTGGFIVAATIGVAYLLKTKQVKRRMQFLFLVGLFGVFIFYNMELFEESIHKFDSSSHKNTSLVARISSLAVPFSIFKEVPLFGAGISEFVVLYEEHAMKLYGFVLKAEGQSTNTFMNALGTFGLFFFLLIIIGWFKFTRIFGLTRLLRVFIFLSLLLMFSNEDMRYSLFFTIILFYGYGVNKKINYEK